MDLALALVPAAALTAGLAAAELAAAAEPGAGLAAVELGGALAGAAVPPQALSRSDRPAGPARASPLAARRKLRRPSDRASGETSAEVGPSDKPGRSDMKCFSLFQVQVRCHVPWIVRASVPLSRLAR